MVNKLDKQTFTCELESCRVFHSYGLVPHPNKKLSKLQLQFCSLAVWRLHHRDSPMVPSENKLKKTWYISQAYSPLYHTRCPLGWQNGWVFFCHHSMKHPVGYVKWEVGDHTSAVLWDAAFRICSKQHEASLCTFPQVFSLIIFFFIFFCSWIDSIIIFFFFLISKEESTYS